MSMMAVDDERRPSLALDDVDFELAEMRPHHTLGTVIAVDVSVFASSLYVCGLFDFLRQSIIFVAFVCCRIEFDAIRLRA